MEWVETTGRTVDEAKEAALDRLGVDEQDAEFEIVEEARFGLFGRLRSEARVRARVRPTKPRAKEERRDRRGRRRAPGSDGTQAGEESIRPTSPPQTSGRRSSDENGSGNSRRSPAPVAVPIGNTTPPEKIDADEQGAEGVGGRSSRRRGRGPSTAVAGASSESMRSAARSPRPQKAHQSAGDDENMSPGGGMDVALDEQGAVAKEFLDGLVARMSLDAEVTIIQVEEETIELNLEGQDLGLLIGPKGSTLLAIQDLTRTVVQRRTSAANGRIMVDVAGYRRKRKDALTRFSRQVAEEVQTSGTRRVLEPMSAADRKIVHDTVNDIEGVSTISEGEEPQRRVVILPTPEDGAGSEDD